MTLTRSIAVYIPSTVRGNEPAPPEVIDRWVKAAKIKLATLFGGFTAYPATGGWVSVEYGLIEETVTVVRSFTDDLGIINKQEAVRQFAMTVALGMEQEAVSIQLDNTLEFVGTTSAVELKVV